MAVVIVVYMIANRTKQDSPYSPSVSIPSSPTVSPKTVPKSGRVKVTPLPPISSKTYSDYVKEYEGRRIQFDQNCQVNPNQPTYKNGTKVMLDNRSAEVKKVAVGGIGYSLEAYGYQIITLYSKNVPQELTINCGAAVNVGKILLQAVISQ